jgi:hypothetical protein
MSANSNKASALGAIIILATACAISISAQTPLTVNSFTVKPDSIRETSETPGAKKSVPLGEGTDSTTGPEEISEINPRAEVSDPVGAHAGTSPAAGAGGEGRGATMKPASAIPQPAATDTWQFQLTPYLWIASISGRAGIGNLIIDTSTSVTDSNVELNFGFMGTLEARKNRFVILTDLQYSDLSTERGNPGPLFSSTRASFKTFVLDPEVGYRILDNEKGAFVDVLGGLRYWHVNGTLDFAAGISPAVKVSRSRSWVDGVVGLRGRAALSPRWFVTGKADLGGGGSNFTYQLFGGVGLNVGKRYALIGGYRDLNVNYNKDGFLFDMSLHGPILGFGIKF